MGSVEMLFLLNLDWYCNEESLGVGDWRVGGKREEKREGERGERKALGLCHTVCEDYQAMEKIGAAVF